MGVVVVSVPGYPAGGWTPGVVGAATVGATTVDVAAGADAVTGSGRRANSNGAPDAGISVTKASTVPSSAVA